MQARRPFLADGKLSVEEDGKQDDGDGDEAVYGEIDALCPICMPTFWPLFNSLVELPDIILI